MRVAIEAHIAEILEENPRGLHIDELAKKTGIDSTKLRRIMRALATRHCFSEG